MSSSATITELMEDVAALPEAEEVFYQTAEFWVSVTFVIVVIILYSPLAKAAKDILQKRIEHIKKDLTDAENIKLEAQSLYAETERKLANVEQETADIVANKKYLIEETKQKKISELNQAMQHKKDDLTAKMELASSQLNQEINHLVCQKTVSTLRQLISTKLTKNEYSILIDNSIENIRNIKIGG